MSFRMEPFGINVTQIYCTTKNAILIAPNDFLVDCLMFQIWFLSKVTSILTGSPLGPSKPIGP